VSSRSNIAAIAFLKLKRGLAVVLLMGLAISVLYPLAWTVMSSIRNPQEFFLNPWGLPTSINFSVYKKVWNEFYVGRALLNSLTIASLTVILSLAFSLTASFAIARMRWRFSNVVLAFLLTGLMIPGHSTIIPLYLTLIPVIEAVGAKNAILIPYVAGTLPISVFIISSYMRSLPNSVEEAAIIDGCNIRQLFFRIIIPMSLPAVASVTIFNFLGVWNELMLALVFLTKNAEQTLPLALLRFSGRFGTQWSETLATVSIAVIPSILLYVILQEKLIKGMTAGSVKG
jgi:raffinose/stachyose/melibiose transport system permease protein